MTVSANSAYSKADVPGGVNELRRSRDMFEPIKSITASSLGLNQRFDGITDICSGKDGEIFLLCGEESRLIMIESDYLSGKEIYIKDKNGDLLNYRGASGVFCDDDGSIYIADTLNAQIIIANKTGQLIQILEEPKSSLIPKDFIYQPTSVQKDEDGYIYILSLGCYYGALVFSPEKEFLGFYGANTVKASALDTLSFLWNKLTGNEKKNASSVKTLPYSFVDFCIDKEGYMVTCTGSTSLNEIEQGQIRKISYNGAEILYKRTLEGESVPASSVNFLEDKKNSLVSAQNMVSVATDDKGFIFGLDRTTGTVYYYDCECNLLSAFGGGIGSGEQLGAFNTPVSLSVHKSNLLVADKENSNITVFSLTEYGKNLCEAQNLTLKGNYKQAKPLWEKVLSDNRNCQLAYRGLAIAHYNEGNYNKALEMAKIAADYSVYDLAWKEIVSKWVFDNFLMIALITVLLIAFIIWFIVYSKKKKIIKITNPRLKLMLETPFHPFRSYEDLKYKKLGSYPIAITLTVLFYIISVLEVTSSGFLYKGTLLRNYNSLFTLGSTIGLILLWSVANWLTCSLFSGKGNFKEVFTSTTYALFPWLIFKGIKIILSLFLPYSGAVVLNGIETVLLIYTIFLISIAVMKIHEYDFFKFITTTLATVFFMLLIVFIILMCAILIKQLGAFFVSVYDEIVYR